MTKNPAVRRFIGLAVAAMISVGVAAPVGLAQDADYGEQSPVTGLPVKLGPPAPPGSNARAAQLKLCKAKAKAKFGGNQVKKKKALKKCKKKYG